MNLEVGVLKNYARVDRIAPCDNIPSESLALERCHKCQASGLNRHRHIVGCLVRRDRSAPTGSYLGFPLEKEDSCQGLRT